MAQEPETEQPQNVEAPASSGAMPLSLDEPVTQAQPVQQPGAPTTAPTLQLDQAGAGALQLDEPAEPHAAPPAPTSTIRSNNMPTMKEALMNPLSAGKMVKMWTDNVANDMKYGTDTTGFGTLLKRLGAHGLYNGSPEQVADFMASLPLGLLKMYGAAAGAVGNMGSTPWQSTKGMVGGAADTLTMPSAFVAPEGASKTLEEGGNLATAAARGAGNTVRRVGKAFSELDQVDHDAIAHAQMRGVQPKIQSGIRSVMKSIEGEAGIEKPAGATPEAPVEQQSIRDAVKKTSDAFMARAKGLYAQLDQAMGGRFQKYEQQLKDVQKEMEGLISAPDEESMDREAALDAKKARIEANRDAALDRAVEQGVPANAVESARADFKKSSALQDLDYAVKKTAKGARPNNPNLLPEDLAADPEMIHPDRLANRLNGLYDSGRLQEAVGEEAANKMLADASKNLVDYKKGVRTATEEALKRIRTNKVIRRSIGAGAVIGAGTVIPRPVKTAITHVFVPGLGVTPAQ